MGQIERRDRQIVSNRLLAALPRAVLAQMPLHAMPVAAGQVLHGANVPIQQAYFLNSGVAALTITFSDGRQAEVGLIGREGMVGLPLFFGASEDVAEAVVQVGGVAWTMGASAFRRELEQSPELARSVLQYSEMLRIQTEQTAACNSHHSLQQRLARTLLMLHDRVGAPELAITQDRLAGMLATHRPSLTVVAGRLQKAGLIRHHGGHVLILDHAGLERVACECYGIIRKRLSALPENLLDPVR